MYAIRSYYENTRPQLKYLYICVVSFITFYKATKINSHRNFCFRGPIACVITSYSIHYTKLYDENDDQNGLAHFLEHMAFNGTQHFPDKGILNTLQKHGVAFGRNINAYTSFDETVYNLSEVPTTHPGLVDTCLLILNDWAHYLLLTDTEIDAERGVITEEWRTRRTSSFRIRNQFFPVFVITSYSIHYTKLYEARAVMLLYPKCL